MEGMLFDAGTWWLVTTHRDGRGGVDRVSVWMQSVFKALDENRADIKEVRRSYTTDQDHKDDLDDIRREIKEVSPEKTRYSASEDIKEVKEKCPAKADFERSVSVLKARVVEY